MADQLLPVDLAATRQQRGLALHPAGDPQLSAVGTPTSQFNTNEVAARIMTPSSQTSSPINVFCTAVPNSTRRSTSNGVDWPSVHLPVMRVNSKTTL